MALFPRPLCLGLLFLCLWLLYSSSPEKVSLGGVLDRRLYVASSVSSEEDSDSSDEHLHRARRNFFFSLSISRCISLSFFAWETWLFPHDWLLLVCVVCTSFMISPLLRVYNWVITLGTPWFRPVRIIITLMWPIVGWCKPDSSIFSTKPKSPSDQIKLIPTDGANCKDQFWLGLQNRSGLRPNNPKQ